TGLDHIQESGIRGAKKFASLIAEHRAGVELARKLVRIETAVPLALTPADLEWPGIDHQAVADLLRELEFGSLVAELTPAQAAIPRLHSDSEIRVDPEMLGEVLERLRNSPRLSLHLGTQEGDTNGQLELRAGQDFEVLKLKDVRQPETFVLSSALIGRAGPLLKSAIPKTCHDLKSHLGRLRRYEIEELSEVEFDTMLAAFLVNPGRPEPSLETVYHEHLAPLGGPDVTGSEPAIIEALSQRLATRLEEHQLTRLFTEIELPVARILAAMERYGIGVDASALQTMSREFGEQLSKLEHECFELAGRDFNLGSPIQLRQVLFGELKLPVKGLKKNKSGYSTDADALEKLA
ncbi:MAG: DNA polymerase, partial [Blastocatellia bacterium]